MLYSSSHHVHHFSQWVSAMISLGKKHKYQYTTYDCCKSLFKWSLRWHHSRIAMPIHEWAVFKIRPAGYSRGVRGRPCACGQKRIVVIVFVTQVTCKFENRPVLFSSGCDQSTFCSPSSHRPQHGHRRKRFGKDLPWLQGTVCQCLISPCADVVLLKEFRFD